MSALLQGVPRRNVAGAIMVTLGTDAPDHFANGIPYEADGSVCAEAGTVTHYHQGMPFTANGRIASSETTPDHFGNGAIPISADDGTSGGPGAITHYSSGVAYTADGRIVFQLVGGGGTLGPELILNGGFDAGAADWTLPGGAVWNAGGWIEKPLSTTANMTQANVPFTAGLIYRVTLDADLTFQDVYVRLGFTDNSYPLPLGTSSFSQDITAGAANPNFILRSVGGGWNLIDNISVKQVL
jgi:hypothetical protein